MNVAVVADTEEIVSRLHALDLVQHFERKRILITGARGFLGQAFVRVFSKLGAEVIAMDRYKLAAELGAAPVESLPGVENWDHDATAVMPHLPGKIDYILSLAAIASPIHYARRPLDCFDVIVQGTRNMAELAARKGATMLLSSTSELYGDPPPSTLSGPTGGSDESHIAALDPWKTVRARAYDVPKLASEALASIYTEDGVKIRTVRYFNVFGPGMARGDYRVMCKFAAAVADKQPITLFGGGAQTRSFCYITDAVVGSLLVLAKGDAKPYNIGNPALECTMKELAAAFSVAGVQAGGVTTTVVSVDPPAAYTHEPRRRRPNIARLAALGFEPKVGTAEGVERFLGWALDAYKAG